MFFLGFKQFQDPYYQGFAAQIAFYIMLSIAPTVILLSSLLGRLNISLDLIELYFSGYVSDDMLEMLKKVISGGSSRGNDIALLFLGIWAASRAQFALMRIANYIYSGGQTTGNYFKERLRSIPTMLLLIIAMAFVTTILINGYRILELFAGKIVEYNYLIKLWGMLRWPLAALLFFVTISILYYFLPLTKLRYRDILPGSVFGAIGILAITFIYTIYLKFIARYNLIYGALSSVVALMFWFYFLSWVITLGVLLNKVWHETKNI